MTNKPIRYRFVDINNNTYDIDAFDQPVPKSDDIKSDIKIIEKTFRDGGVFSGILRIMSKEIEFEYNLEKNNDTDFRSEINNMLVWARSAVKIRDIILNLETSILFSDIKISYGIGGFLRDAKVKLTFKRTNPYWESLDYIQYNIALPSGGTSGQIQTISIINNGYTDTPPIITLTAQELTTKFLFHIPSTNEGIYVKDTQFGNLGLTEYIVDCTQGYITLSGNKRNNMIQNDTGFFNFPKGTFDLDYQLNGDCDINIKFKERFYI